MPIGVGAAMLIGSAISGGTAIAGAKLQSNAAKNAAKEQQKGTDRALQIQQQANAPYMQLGQQAAQRLGSGQSMAQPYTQQFRAPGGGPQSNGFQPFQPGGQSQMPTLGSIGQMGPQGPPQGQPSMPQPQMVNLQAPDGSVRPFPVQDAPRIIAQAKAAGHELRQVN